MDSARLKLPDFLKGVAVLMMVQVHITELFAVQSFYHGFFGKVSLFLGSIPAAPLFMIVMGFFIVRKIYTFKTNIQRGLKLLLWGLLLNLGLNANLLIHIITGKFNYEPLPYILGSDILFLAGFSLIIIAVIQKFAKDNWLFYLILAILVAVLSDLIPSFTRTTGISSYIMAFIHSEAWWSYFPILPWLAYPLTGVALGLLAREKPDSLKILASHPAVPMIAVLYFLLYAYPGLRIATDLSLYYHHGLLFFFWALALMSITAIVMFHLLQLLVNTRFLNTFCWVGKNVTAFYVFQWLIIGNLATELYKTQNPVNLVFWYIIIVAVSSFLVYQWNNKKREVSAYFLEKNT